MIKRILLVCALFTPILQANHLTIAVAANVSYAMEDLKKEFLNLYPNNKIRIIIGGSGKLTAQINNGAPYDIFLSANMKYPKYLYDNNLSVTKPIVYAQGSLVYFSIKNINFSKGIKILENGSINKIAVANPKTAPYGIATKEALLNSGIYDKIKYKFIYGESISQTVSYSITATDIGFIAKSALFSPKMSKYKKDINWQEVDSKLYTPIDQGIVILQNGKNKENAKQFYNFIFSQKAKDIFIKFGYIVK